MLVSPKEAAKILGVSLQSVYNLASSGKLTRRAPSSVRLAYDHAELEKLSLARLHKTHHRPHPYWASTEEAAAELGVTRSAVRQMILSDRLPHAVAPNGRRYVRRHQLEVIANVREIRTVEDRLAQLRKSSG